MVSLFKAYMIIACTLNNCFSRSNTKFTLIHKCMPLPIHQDGVENRHKAYCRFASPSCDYILFNRKKYKVNYYLGMKDMLGDMMQDHAISVIIVIWRALQNRSSVTEHGSFFIPLRLDFFCIGLVTIWSFF